MNKGIKIFGICVVIVLVVFIGIILLGENCKEPYIEYQKGECCLDANTNNICDNEDIVEEEPEVKEEIIVEEIVEEEEVEEKIIKDNYILECTSNCDRGIKITSQEYQSGDLGGEQFLATLNNNNPRGCGMFCSVFGGINQAPYEENEREGLVIIPFGSYKNIQIKINNIEEFQLVCSDNNAHGANCDNRIKQIIKPMEVKK